MLLGGANQIGQWHESQRGLPDRDRALNTSTIQLGCSSSSCLAKFMFNGIQFHLSLLQVSMKPDQILT